MNSQVEHSCIDRDHVPMVITEDFHGLDRFNLVERFHLEESCWSTISAFWGIMGHRSSVPFNECLCIRSTNGNPEASIIKSMGKLPHFSLFSLMQCSREQKYAELSALGRKPWKDTDG